MNTEDDEFVDMLVALASANLNGKSQQSISDLCNFRCGFFAGKKRYHLLRESAFLNLFIIHSVCQAKNIQSEKTNLVFNLLYRINFQGKEDFQAWFSDLLERINRYSDAASSEKAGGVFGIAGSFLLNLRRFDKSFPGFEQVAVAEYISKLFEIIIKTVDKYHA